jgi:hypothetical protein
VGIGGAGAGGDTGSENTGAFGGAGTGDAGVAFGSSNPCAPSGPTVAVEAASSNQSYETCTGNIAANLFVNALCSCDGASFGGYLKTRGFDSAEGIGSSEVRSDSGAAVGINGTYAMWGDSTDVGGSLAIAGTEPWQTTGYLKVRGDLRTAANATSIGIAEVGRNAWFAGDFSGLGALTVGGELHHAGDLNVLSLSASVEREESVSISFPCPCGDAERLPIAAIIDEATRHAVESSIVHLPDDWGASAGQGKVSLACGKYAVSRINVTSNLVLEVTGKSALFVDDSIDIRGDFSVQLATGASLDIFVRKGLAVTGSISLGDVFRPSAGRIYVDGVDDIALSERFTGYLYAPRAALHSEGPITVTGSLFVGSYDSRGPTAFNYDRAILRSGAQCEATSPPPGLCTKCGGCSAGKACIDGSCQACKTDLDCCSQSICNAGSCSPLVMQ